MNDGRWTVRTEGANRLPCVLRGWTARACAKGCRLSLRRALPLSLVVMLSWLCNAAAAERSDRLSWPDLPQDPAEQRFFTFFVNWYDAWEREGAEEDLVAFVAEAKPEVVQVGKFGPMFHSFVHDEGSTGSHLRLPAEGGFEEAFAWQVELLEAIRAVHPDVRIVSHTEMSTIEKEPFIEWFNEKWDENLMGPRPDVAAEDLLVQDADGEVYTRRRGDRFAHLCISNPHVRALMKRTVEIAIEKAGVDGLISNYNYLRGCVCEWCQDEFRAFLEERHDPAELEAKFGISDLQAHTFDEIPAWTPGYPDVDEADELDWAAAEWGARHFKDVFDEVLIEHGRSLHPEFMVATWEHSVFTHRCERAFRPIEDWHRGENYFWYSGAHGDGDLEAGDAGDGWVELLWLRAKAEGKPFMLGKYVRTRIRASLAEGVATGGAGTGLRQYFADEYAREVMARHHNFVHEHRDLYERAVPRSEVGVVLPRQSTLNRRPEAYETVRDLAPKLAKAQVLFEFVVDERIESNHLGRCDLLVLPTVLSVSDEQVAMIQRFIDDGGTALLVGEFATLDARGEPRDGPVDLEGGGAGRVIRIETNGGAAAMDEIAAVGSELSLSTIDGDWTLRAALFEHPGGLALHLVNYDRDEQAAAASRPEYELPIAAREVPVTLNLPPDSRVSSVTLRSPDRNGSIDVEHTRRDGQVTFMVPEVEVYALLDIELAD